MEKHYDTDGINVYLMLTDTDYQVSYETKMLQNNFIPYVIPFNVMFIDGDAIPCYEVNGLTEFAVIGQTITITPVLILQLFQELVMVFHQLGRYLLSVNNLILVEDCIFYDIAQKCFGFIYLPGYQSGVREQMRRLLDQVICRMDHADRAGSDRVYDLYQKIMDANCDLEKLVDFFTEFRTEESGDTDGTGNTDIYRTEETGKTEEEEEAAELDAFLRKEPNRNKWKKSNRNRTIVQSDIDDDKTSVRTIVYKTVVIACMLATALFGISYGWMQYRANGRIQHMKPLFGVCILLAVELFVWMELFLTDQTEKEEEVVEPCIQEQDITIFPAAADGNGQPAAGDTQQETTILPATDPVCMLVPVGGQAEATSNPVICLDTLPRLIGRGDMADFCISDKSVSRVHSRIRYIDHKYVLEDMGSTNGTYVNGYPLRVDYPAVVLPGDIISFGNIEYELRAQI